ncbi:MAG: hypothetical protein KBA71_05585 [Opitutaceae bacterium]|nr:hypothetical protein [Opitutaceae bacterium]
MSISTSVPPFDPTTKLSSAPDSDLPDEVMEDDTCTAAFADILGQTTGGKVNAGEKTPAAERVAKAGPAKAPTGASILLHLALPKAYALPPESVPVEGLPEQSDESVATTSPGEADSDGDEGVAETDANDNPLLSELPPRGEDSPTTSATFGCVEASIVPAHFSESPVDSENTDAAPVTNAGPGEARVIGSWSSSDANLSPAMAVRASHSRNRIVPGADSPGQPLQEAVTAGVAGAESQEENLSGAAVALGAFATAIPSRENSIAGMDSRTVMPGTIRLAGSKDHGSPEGTGSHAAQSSLGSEAKIGNEILNSAQYAAGGPPVLQAAGYSGAPGALGAFATAIPLRENSIVGADSRTVMPGTVRLAGSKDHGSPGGTGSHAAESLGMSHAKAVENISEMAESAVPGQPGGSTLKLGDELPGKYSPSTFAGFGAMSAGVRLSPAAAEKYADRAVPVQSLRKADDKSTSGVDKRTSLDSEDKLFTDINSRVGTETANPLAPMLHDSRHPRFAALPGDSVISGVGHSANSGSLGRADPETAASNSKAAVAAVEAIRQITDAADVLWATERSGVNLRLKLDDVGVAVSVAYRDGEIRATFHADSPELRNALSTAWEKHVFSVSDQKPYRFAEPVFSNSQTSSNSDQGAFAQGNPMGGDSSRQSSQQAQRSAPEVNRRSRRGVSSVGAPVAPSQVSQPSGNSSRLHAFA